MFEVVFEAGWGICACIDTNGQLALRSWQFGKSREVLLESDLVLSWPGCSGFCGIGKYQDGVIGE